MGTEVPANLDEALREWGALTRIAKVMQVSPSWLCDVRKGRKVPNLRRAVQLHKLTGVPMESLLPVEVDSGKALPAPDEAVA
jgi:transcriptional regulator with XRE-family HTH domain